MKSKIIPFPKRHGKHRFIIDSSKSCMAYCECMSWYYGPSKRRIWDYTEALAQFEEHCSICFDQEELVKQTDPCIKCPYEYINCKECLER
jgi:hypothetical protein